MSKPMVYLAGPITGLTYDGANDWRDLARDMLADYGIVTLSPLRSKEYLKSAGTLGPGSYPQPLSTPQAITQRDRLDVRRCDLVLFNFLGAQKASVGTCIEVGWADAYGKPGILLIEDTDDPNRPTNPHDHAMVQTICGWRASSLETAAWLTARILLP